MSNVSKKHELTEFDKVCFGCTLPFSYCGSMGRSCAFTKATGHNRHLRNRIVLVQNTCGIKDRISE